MNRMIGGFLLVAALAAAPVSAQAVEPAFTLAGDATLVSDYRWRGYSLSNKGWAIQGALEVAHESGFFIGTWASSIAEVGNSFSCDPPTIPPAPPVCALVSGATVEVDVYGGWAGTLGPLDVSAGLLAYLYPGAEGLNYFEFTGTVGYTIGTLELGAGLHWAPNQGALTGANRYLYGSAAFTIPDTPLTLKAIVGAERGSVVVDKTFARTAKIDWLFGVDMAGSVIGLEPLTIGFAYSGNNLPDRSGLNNYATSGFIFSIGASF